MAHARARPPRSRRAGARRSLWRVSGPRRALRFRPCKRSRTDTTSTSSRTVDAVIDIVKTHYGAYGIGVEYAYTMVHGTPSTPFPQYVVPKSQGH